MPSARSATLRAPRGCHAAESRRRSSSGARDNPAAGASVPPHLRRPPMPQKAWSDKRERQYEHIKDSYEDRGVSTDEAEERAARTVNKERAEHGETKAAKKR